MSTRVGGAGLLSALKHSMAYSILGRSDSKPPLPRALCLYVTYRCNMKCRICGIWGSRNQPHSPELTCREFLELLHDPLFAKLEFININGGEPNLRPDLPDFIRGLIRLFPSLKQLSLSTNGLPTGKAVENITLASRLCRAAAVRFSACVSLHGVGEGFDRVAGVKNAFGRVKATLDALKEVRRAHPFYLSSNCVISSLNIDQLDAVRAWGRAEGIPVNFSLGEVRPRFLNEAMAEDILIPPGGRKRLARFLRRLALEKREYLQHALRYAALAEAIESPRKRTLACHYALAGVVLGSRGELFYCKNSRTIGNALRHSARAIYFDPSNLRFRREEILGRACPTCPPYSFNQVEVEKEVFKILSYLLVSS